MLTLRTILTVVEYFDVCVIYSYSLDAGVVQNCNNSKIILTCFVRRRRRQFKAKRMSLKLNLFLG